MPEHFTVHPKLKGQLERRLQTIEEGGIDWGQAEALAFGSLLQDGRPVRLVGQDSRRGTFGQRHAVLVDRRTGEEYTPLKKLDNGQARFLAPAFGLMSAALLARRLQFALRLAF